ncbi:MAG TPA: ATP-binding protein [Candidatus Saccharimonadia bacterium]|nr:ATP-binding protein [Candidatus Saccharimonadia bacterium]
MIPSAIFKLTLWYLGIILVLSSLFSLALYRESVSQITENADHQRTAVMRLPLPGAFEPRRTEFLQALDRQLDLDQRRIILRLLALNLSTLLLGGAASYFLARRTLRPIHHAMEAQGRFTADASHELRTPLTAMRSEIEVALRQKQLTAAEARELLTSNLEEIAKLEALSSGLLRLARFEGGLDPAAVSQVPVADLFSEAIHRFQALITERKLNIATVTGELTVAGDRDSLIELVAILLDNAIKYSPPESTISLGAQPSNHFVRMSVADEGVGIKPADIPHIFDRFYRADRSRSKHKINGYGLGLSIAKRIVDLHHGTIVVESTPGKGTMFKIKLPAEYTAKQSLLS